MEKQVELLNESIRRFQLNITDLISHYTEKENLTIAQYRVLLALALSGPSPMNNLAKLLRITTPAVTHLIDRLEALKVVKRHANPKDRRSFIIEFTAKGEAILKSTQGRAMKFLTDAFLTFSDKERETVLRFYKTLNKDFDEKIAPNIHGS